MSISISFPVSVEGGEAEGAELAALGAWLRHGRGPHTRKWPRQRRRAAVPNLQPIAAQDGEGAWLGARGGVASAELRQLGKVGGGKGALEAAQKVQEEIGEGTAEARPVLLQEGAQAPPTSQNSQHLLPEVLLGQNHQGAPFHLGAGPPQATPPFHHIWA